MKPGDLVRLRPYNDKNCVSVINDVQQRVNLPLYTYGIVMCKVSNYLKRVFIQNQFYSIDIANLEIVHTKKAK